MVPVWENVPCPLCNQRNEEELLHRPADSGAGADVYRLVRCHSCSMTYMNPRPDVKSIGHFYEADYSPYKTHAPKPTRFWNTWFPKRDSVTHLPITLPGRLLDYGCGGGTYLLKMQQLGWQVEGMDFSPHAVATTRKLGFQVHQGMLPHPDVEAASYDLVNIGAVLEHVHDPHLLVQAAKRILKPGGHLVISVPNIESWGFTHFRSQWWPLELPRHLLHFSETTLLRLAAEHGLEVKEVRYPARTGWMRRSKEMASLHPEELSETGRSTLRWMNYFSPAIGWVTRWTSWKKQADCLMLIAQRPFGSILANAA